MSTGVYIRKPGQKRRPVPSKLILCIMACTHCDKEMRLSRATLRWNPGRYCSYACRNEARKIDGGRWTNPEKIREYQRSYALKNREKINALSRQWARRNNEKRNLNYQKRRAARHGVDATLTKQEWVDLLSICGNKCLRCGCMDRIEQDHVTPITKGGAHSLANIQPLCRRCNASKGDIAVDYRIGIKKKLMRACFGLEIEIR